MKETNFELRRGFKKERNKVKFRFSFWPLWLLPFFSIMSIFHDIKEQWENVKNWRRLCAICVASPPFCNVLYFSFRSISFRFICRRNGRNRLNTGSIHIFIQISIFEQKRHPFLYLSLRQSDSCFPITFCSSLLFFSVGVVYMCLTEMLRDEKYPSFAAVDCACLRLCCCTALTIIL